MEAVWLSWQRKSIILLLVFFMLALIPSAFAGGPPEPAKSTQLAEKFRRLPSSFEANMGQSGSAVRFVSQGPGYAIHFQDHEADFILAKKDRPSGLHSRGFSAALPAMDATSAVDVVRMRLIGASAESGLSGLERLPGTVNYFSGSNPANWHTGIPTFAKVQYRGIYPGVNLVYYGNPSKLEFDFQVAPGASASDIRFHFDGAAHVQVDSNGSLTVTANHGHVNFQKPLIYQAGARDTKEIVRGGFRMYADGTVGFTIDRYDHTRPLVIDPILDYSTYLGVMSGASAVAVDAAGEAFVAGYAGAGLPTTAGSYQPDFPASGKDDPAPVGSSLYTGTAAFVAKFNSAGTELLYCTYISGSQNDAADAIAVDAAGNAYIAGATASPDFPVTAGAFQTANHAARAGTGFIAELNSSGSALVYSTFLGGSQETSITSLALDSAMNVFVTGFTADLDFPVTPGAYRTQSPANPIVGGKGFITKLAAGGQKLVYSTYIGGSRWDLPYGIAIDGDGNAYIAGGTQSPDFPTTPGAFQTVNKATIFNLLGGSFVSKLNASGTALVYSTYLDGSSTDVAYAIAVDTAGSAYVTGFATSTDFPTTAGVLKPALGLTPLQQAAGQSNVFVTKLKPSGTGLIYSTFLGGSQSINPGVYSDTGYAIAVDSTGNAYIAGSTEDIDFPITAGALQTENISQSFSGDLASFVAKIDPAASKILYATYLTGSGDQSGDPAGVSCDCAAGVALDSSQNLYVVGRTISTDFPTTLGAIQNQSKYGASAFIAKFDGAELEQLPLSTTTLTASSNPQFVGQPITFTATVRSSSGSIPTGTVGFSYEGLLANGTPYAFGPWNNVVVDGSGAATFTTSALPSGSIAVVAYYLGDTSNSPSRGAISETVNQIPTTTTITANPSSAPYEQPITFTAKVIETASGKPAQGSVFFLLGSTSFQFSALDSSGQATWTSGGAGEGGVLPVGSQTITAEFTTLTGAPDKTSQGSVTVNITALGSTAPPAFSPAGGTYASVQNVTLSSATANAVIYYTVDGSSPTSASLLYLNGFPIQVGSSETIRAIAIAPGDSASAVASATYVINLPAPAFTVSGTAVTVTPGATTGNTSTITVKPVGAFTGSVTLTAAITSSPANAVSIPTLSFGTSTPVSIDSGATGTATLLITTTQGITSPCTASNHERQATSFYARGGAILACVLLIGIPAHRRRWRTILGVSAFILVLSGGIAACGGGGGKTCAPVPATGGTTAGSYTVTVTGSSGATTATGTFNLTVQ